MRRALLVGIDDYPENPLAGCRADAEAVSDLLAANADGSPNFDCQLLTAPPDHVTRSSLRESIEQLLAQPAEVALFYFSGHGTENNLGGFLVTPDARRYDEGVPMSQLLTYANDSPVREVILVIDCCHSGALGAIPGIDNNSAHLRQGLSVITASRASEPAVEYAGRGLFTSLFCDALDGGASDVLGTVTAASAYAYVDQALGPWEQRPLLKAHVSQLAVLRRNVPAVGAETLRRFPEWFPDPHGTMPLDPSFEPTEEPADAVNEAIFAALQRCRTANLVEPVGEDHLYYAAIRSKGCRLTSLGRFYWSLADSRRV